MKKTYLLLALTLIIKLANAQKLSKDQAKKIAELTLLHLQNSDSLAFINLWHYNQDPAPYHKNSFTKKDAANYYQYFKTFLDTALNQKLNIYKIELDKVNREEQNQGFGKHLITVWFKYNENYLKGFGLYLDYFDNRWGLRNIPNTSSLCSVK
jgi:hypothetical protein